MMETTLMIESTDLVSILGKTEDNILDNGKTVNNMEKEPIGKPQAKKRKVIGKMEKE